jgi:exopolyphosphatase/guanosine-5'-triphosphate,3'-diphosphate pyrophosphatase
MRFGVIDVGTNAARLLVGEFKNETSSKIYYTRIPLRLGDDVYSTGFISDQKITDFLDTIHAFELICKSFHVSKIKAVATSAMRDAKNANERQRSKARSGKSNFSVAQLTRIYSNAKRTQSHL